jgi:hypothetical protein
MDSKSDAKSQLKMIMNPPSIPTKFQTIHYDDNEHRGFNSTAKRFEAKGNDLPGPGYYARAAEKLDQAFADVSVSTKGYGGFASKNKRFHNLKATGTEICKYNPHTPEYSYKQALSPAFRQPVYGKPSNNLMIRTKTGLKPTPGTL